MWVDCMMLPVWFRRYLPVLESGFEILLPPETHSDAATQDWLLSASKSLLLEVECIIIIIIIVIGLCSTGDLVDQVSNYVASSGTVWSWVANNDTFWDSLRFYCTLFSTLTSSSLSLELAIFPIPLKKFTFRKHLTQQKKVKLFDRKHERLSGWNAHTRIFCLHV